METIDLSNVPENLKAAWPTLPEETRNAIMASLGFKVAGAPTGGTDTTPTEADIQAARDILTTFAADSTRNGWSINVKADVGNRQSAYIVGYSQAVRSATEWRRKIRAMNLARGWSETQQGAKPGGIDVAWFATSPDSLKCSPGWALATDGQTVRMARLTDSQVTFLFQSADLCKRFGFIGRKETANSRDIATVNAAMSDPTTADIQAAEKAVKQLTEPEAAAPAIDNAPADAPKAKTAREYAARLATLDKLANATI